MKSYDTEMRFLKNPNFAVAVLAMDFYNHGTSCFDPTAWAIWQYHDPEEQSGIVMAFRREESPFDSVKIDLKGLLAGKTYQAENLNDGTAKSITDTLEISLPEKRTSVIFKYKKAAQ